MRWLFLFVLVLNLAYFGWQMSRPDDSGVVRTRPDVPTITLLSELDQGESTPINMDELDNPDANKLTQAVTAPKKEVNPEVVKPVSKPVSKPVAPKDLAETDIDGCYTLGPFRKLDVLRSFTRTIKDYVLNASFRARDETEQGMFWVFIAPTGGYEEAKALTKQLVQKKISDYYMISKGDQKHTVSLGHFKDKDRAYAHSKTIQKLGFKAEVEPVFRSYKLYWLDYQVQPGKSIPESLFKSQLDGRVSRLRRACN